MSFSVIISIVTLWYTYLLSKKKKPGIYLGLICQMMWTVYIIAYIEDPGLLILNLGLYAVLLNGLLKWKD